MASTYEPIATYTLASDTTTTTFSSISNTYTDLILVLANIQTDAAGSSYNAIRLSINGDTSTLYSYTSLNGDGSAASSNRDTGNGYIYTGFAPQASSTDKANSILHFMNANNTTTYKTVLARNNSAAFGTQARVHLYRSTSAISSISVTWDGTTKYKSGCTFTLYGIKAA